MSRMGSAKQETHQSSTNWFAGATPEEQKLVDKLSELGMNQADAIKYVMSEGQKPHAINTVALNSTDQANLDNAYAGAEQNLRRFGNIMGQDLAGTRGLNPSDTPVSEAVLRETMPAYANLMSNKAQYGLGLGLNLAQMNEGARQFNLQSILNGASSMPTGLGFNLQRMLQERSMKNSTTGNGLGYTNGSILDQMNQGAQFRLAMHQGTNQAAQAGGGVMKMMGGM